MAKALQDQNAENVLIIHHTILAALKAVSCQVRAQPMQPPGGRAVRP